MTSMTPDEAANFYEEDEDPGEVFAWFDVGPRRVTARPAAVQEPVSEQVVSRVVASGLSHQLGLYGHLRPDLLPEVSAAGSNSRYAQQA